VQHNAICQDDNLTDELPGGVKLLHGQYEIEQQLVGGGFGLTYLARDSLDRRVVIKECYPSAFCLRRGREVRPRNDSQQAQYESVIRNFIMEARRLARLDHPGIVRVHQVFEENNTAYMAMDLVEGLDLLTIRQADSSRLTREVLEKALRDTLDALDYVHGFDMLHRDISPDNLLLGEDDSLTLIDFGAAREGYCQKSRALSAVLSVKDGYSPHEFYLKDMAQTPSSDLYSVAATFYHLITGSAPPDSQKRLAAMASDCADPYQPLALGPWNLRHNMLVTIDRALSVAPQDRIQSVAEWVELLDCEELLPVDAVQEETGQVPAERVRELDPALFKAISSLVRDTNSHLSPGPHDRALRAMHVRRGPVPQAAPEQDKKNDEAPDQLYDIFGEPVDDVEAWLREQDRMTRKGVSEARQDAGAKPRKTCAPRQTLAASYDETRPKSLVSRLVRALVKGRRRSGDQEMIRN